MKQLALKTMRSLSCFKVPSPPPSPAPSRAPASPSRSPESPPPPMPALSHAPTPPTPSTPPSKRVSATSTGPACDYAPETPQTRLESALMKPLPRLPAEARQESREMERPVSPDPRSFSLPRPLRSRKGETRMERGVLGGRKSWGGETDYGEEPAGAGAEEEVSPTSDRTVMVKQGGAKAWWNAPASPASKMTAETAEEVEGAKAFALRARTLAEGEKDAGRRGRMKAVAGMVESAVAEWEALMG